MNRICKLTIAAALLVLLIAVPAMAADIVVIVNKDNANSVNKSMVEKIYKGDMTSWPDGGSIKPMDLPENSSVRETFTSWLVGMTVAKLKAAWAVKLFSGKATPPKVLGSDSEVVREVARTRNAIGYVSAGSADGSVKVVLTL